MKRHHHQANKSVQVDLDTTSPTSKQTNMQHMATFVVYYLCGLQSATHFNMQQYSCCRSQRTTSEIQYLSGGACFTCKASSYSACPACCCCYCSDDVLEWWRVQKPRSARDGPSAVQQAMGLRGFGRVLVLLSTVAQNSCSCALEACATPSQVAHDESASSSRMSSFMDASRLLFASHVSCARAWSWVYVVVARQHTHKHKQASRKQC